MQQSANADALAGEQTCHIGRGQYHCASMVMAIRMRDVFSTDRMRDGQSSESAFEMAIKMRDAMLSMPILDPRMNIHMMRRGCGIDEL